ncbi:hypothetical protein CDAR_320651 [Caerostris darwini]|uniref:Uncharacterized protein n=1 Tax=Caerostris darwini TaxID=1538125 RepID=A0AAV4WX94_9ARAC|nr:hypothetical protein CDAR_320651 [Caerostris darwini]
MRWRLLTDVVSLLPWQPNDEDEEPGKSKKAITSPTLCPGKFLLGTVEDNPVIMETSEDDLFAELPMSRLVSIECSFAELSAVAIHFSLDSYMGISPSLPM